MRNGAIVAVLLHLCIGFTAVRSFGKEIHRVTKPVPGRYVVLLNESSRGHVSATAASALTVSGGRVIDIWDRVVLGFSFAGTDAQASALLNDPRVASVEETAIVALASTQYIPQGPLVPGSPATMWGLERLDQPYFSAPRADGLFSYCSTASTVRVYVVDSGIEQFHTEFGGSCVNADCSVPQNRVASSRVDKALSLRTLQYQTGFQLGDECWDQLNFVASAGHGTAVSSIIGGATFGVAKGVTLVDARTFSCWGTSSTDRVIQTLNWIPTDPNRGSARVVVNASFTSFEGQSLGLSAAVDSLVNNFNILVAVAAGNNAQNTFWYEPANAYKAIVAGGINQACDSEWAYSNYGNIAFYAPSQFVEAAHIQLNHMAGANHDYLRSEATDCYDYRYHDTCTSGTSFATAFVSGAVARVLWTAPGADRDYVITYLTNQSAVHNGITITSRFAGSAPLLNLNDSP